METKDYQNGYYVHVTNQLKCKNKLQEELALDFKVLDGLLLTNQQFADFNVIIADTVELKNNKYNRCKPEKYTLNKINDTEYNHYHRYNYYFSFMLVSLLPVKSIF